MSRTNSSQFLNSGSVFNLAQSTVSYVSESLKNITTYQKVDLKTRNFYTVSEKTPSKFAFFFRKMAK